MKRRKWIAVLMVVVLSIQVVFTLPHRMLAATTPGQDHDLIDTTNGVIGVTISFLPHGASVVQDEYLSSAYGFSVVGKSGELLMRVEWLWKRSPSDMYRVVSKFESEFPKIKMKRSRIRVGRHAGVALSPVPGQVETTAVFVVANGRLYRILFNDENKAGKETIQNITFVQPRGDISSLHIPKADDMLYLSPPGNWNVPPRRPSSEPKSSFLSDDVYHPYAYTLPGCGFPCSGLGNNHLHQGLR